jgi:hypothetical protein
LLPAFCAKPERVVRPLDTNLSGESAVLVQRTLRSGFRLAHQGHVVVIGDVNPGAEIVAGGSIVVWGRLRGVVHAGANGNEDATICALDMNPTQLRIASFFSVTPQRKGKSQPEIARVKGWAGGCRGMEPERGRKMTATVVTVTSGKGGVGKTTTTANVAVALAQDGFKVVCIDGDIGLRNLDVVMGLENRIVYDLVDVVEGRCRLRQAMIRDKRLPELYLIPRPRHAISQLYLLVIWCACAMICARILTGL